MNDKDIDRLEAMSKPNLKGVRIAATHASKCKVEVGVSKVFWQNCITVADATNNQKIIAVCGIEGAQDEIESFANAILIAAFWNKNFQK